MGIRCILDHGRKMYLVKEPKHADLTCSVGLSSDEYGFVISVFTRNNVLIVLDIK